MQDLVSSADVLSFAFWTCLLASVVRQACAVPVSVPFPAPFRQATFSLPWVRATAVPSLFTVFKHFCWAALCCANAPEALTTISKLTAAVVVIIASRIAIVHLVLGGKRTFRK